MAEIISVGDARTLYGEWDVDGTPTDPTVVTFTVRTPAGDSTDYIFGTDPEVVQDSTGRYHLDLLLDSPGLWTYRLVGTGAAAGTKDGSFYVEATLVSVPGLCTLNDVQVARRGMPAVLDELVEALIRRASEACRVYCKGREFAIVDIDTDRRFPLCGSPVWVGDLAAVPTAVESVDAFGATVATFDVTEGTGDLVYHPQNRSTRDPIRAIGFRPPAIPSGHEIVVTGTWGHPVIPEDVREACVTAVVEWLKGDQALTLPSPDQFEPGSPPERGLPLKARDLLRPYRDVLVR